MTEGCSLRHLTLQEISAGSPRVAPDALSSDESYLNLVLFSIMPLSDGELLALLRDVLASTVADALGERCAAAQERALEIMEAPPEDVWALRALSDEFLNLSAETDEVSVIDFLMGCAFVVVCLQAPLSRARAGMALQHLSESQVSPVQARLAQLDLIRSLLSGTPEH